MLDPEAIEARLAYMRGAPAPEISWDETCEGSGRALVIFVGPSPGGQKPQARRSMHKACMKPLWDQSFEKPLSWSAGFRASFRPLVEELFQLPYSIAGKLIARANLDWLGNPESEDVAEEFMFEGSPSTLQLIEDCSPDLLLPMDFRTFRVLREVLRNADYQISNCHVTQFSVLISERSNRHHRRLHAFWAGRNSSDILVMKLPQHPARMLEAAYGARCGKALRIAALQIVAERNRQDPESSKASTFAAELQKVLDQLNQLEKEMHQDVADRIKEIEDRRVRAVENREDTAEEELG